MPCLKYNKTPKSSVEILNLAVGKVSSNSHTVIFTNKMSAHKGFLTKQWKIFRKIKINFFKTFKMGITV